jgi:hypothetical protein
MMKLNMTNFENGTETLREEQRGVKANRRREGSQRGTMLARDLQNSRLKPGHPEALAVAIFHVRWWGTSAATSE